MHTKMIKDKINSDLKTAMLGGDKERVSVLRVAKSVILDAEVKQGARDSGLEDSEVEAILQKEVKKRNEAATIYKQASDETRAKQELYEVEVLSIYLPEALSESEIEKIVDEVIASSADLNMGQIIGMVKSKAGSSADGGMIAGIVKSKL